MIDSVFVLTDGKGEAWWIKRVVMKRWPETILVTSWDWFVQKPQIYEIQISLACIFLPPKYIDTIW